MKALKSKKLEIPSEIKKALTKNSKLITYFQSLPPSHQKEYIAWISSGKKEETRIKRIEKMLIVLEKELKNK